MDDHNVVIPPRPQVGIANQLIADISPLKPIQAKRDNAGKTPYANLPLDLLDGAAWVMKHGEKTYGRENYRLGYDDLFEPLDSLLRHTTAVQHALSLDDKDGAQGKLIDEKSGYAHIHHVITCALLLLNAMRMKGWKV